MNLEYELEIEALKLLYKNWDDLPEADRMGIHDNFMWSISAAVEVGLVQFNQKASK